MVIQHIGTQYLLDSNFSNLVDERGLLVMYIPKEKRKYCKLKYDYAHPKSSGKASGWEWDGGDIISVPAAKKKRDDTFQLLLLNGEANFYYKKQ